MLPGPQQILKLPGSGHLVKIATIASGNTFGARYWTDGKRDAPMLPDRPWLRRHPATGELFWTDECETIGENSPWKEEPTHPDVPFAETPDMNDLLRVLETDLTTNPDKERYVRMRYWWQANDPVREGGGIAGDPEIYRTNLARLRQLLTGDEPEQRLMSIEAARESGDFAAATAQLDFTFSEEYSRAVKLLETLIAERETRVSEIT